MRSIKRSTTFKKDYKRVKANPKHAKNLNAQLSSLLQMLVQDKPLPDTYRDHDLIGNWKGFRECHLKPDLLLIYRQLDDELQLARLGSHNELFK